MPRLSELANVFVGMRIAPAQQNNEGQYLVVKPKNIINRTVSPSRADWHINEIDNERFARYVLIEDDIVVNRIGSPFRAGLYTHACPPAIADSTIIVIRSRGGTRINYIVEYLSREDGRRNIESIMHGSLHTINLRDLRSLDMPNPPDPFIAADPAEVARRHEERRLELRRQIPELIIKIRTFIDKLNQGEGDFAELWEFHMLVDELRDDCLILNDEAGIGEQGISQALTHLNTLSEELGPKLDAFIRDLDRDNAFDIIIHGLDQMRDRFI